MDVIACRKAVNTCYRIFWPYFFPCVLEWNVKEQSYYTSFPGKKYVLWFYSMFVHFGGIGFTPIIISVLYSDRLMMHQIMLPISVAYLMCFIMGCAAVMYMHVENIVFGFQQLKQIFNLLHGQVVFHIKTPSDLQLKKWKLVNQFIHGFLAWLATCPVIIPLFAVLYKLDQLSTFYELCIRPYFCDNNDKLGCDKANSYATWIILPIYFSFWVEGVRSYSVMVTSIFWWLEMQTKYLLMLAKIPSTKKFFKFYIYLQLALRTIQSTLFEWIRLWMATMFFTIVSCVIIMSKYWDDLPMEVAWFIPFNFTVHIGMTLNIFPFIVIPHEITKELLHDQRSKLFSGKGGLRSAVQLLDYKVARKQLRSLKPIAWKCGDGFILKRDTQTTFYDAIVGRCVEGVLM